MGLQRKTGAGIYTQVRQPFGVSSWDQVSSRPPGFVRELGPCSFGVLLFATHLRQQERLCQDEKGRKDSCWWAMRRCRMALD